MTGQERELPEIQTHLRFIVAVVNGCKESEGAVLNLLEAGLAPQNIQMFYAHRMPVHTKSLGLRSGQLQVTLEYLEDLMGLDVSISREYEEYWKAGRHILLVNVYRDSEAGGVATSLGKSRPHAGRILGYGHTAELLTHAN